MRGDMYTKAKQLMSGGPRDVENCATAKALV
eukprot:COSAG06_NODE_33789_length_484_cov_0.672727_1_plen_30_part_10